MTNKCAVWCYELTRNTTRFFDPFRNTVLRRVTGVLRFCTRGCYGVLRFVLQRRPCVLRCYTHFKVCNT